MSGEEPADRRVRLAILRFGPNAHFHMAPAIRPRFNALDRVLRGFWSNPDMNDKLKI